MFRSLVFGRDNVSDQWGKEGLEMEMKQRYLFGEKHIFKSYLKHVFKNSRLNVKNKMAKLLPENKVYIIEILGKGNLS